MYIVLKSKAVIVDTTPYFRKSINKILCPLAAAVSETITLAAAPTIVTFPPRQAPNDRHHHIGAANSAPFDSAI